jgi:Isochorismatase family
VRACRFRLAFFVSDRASSIIGREFVIQEMKSVTPEATHGRQRPASGFVPGTSSQSQIILRRGLIRKDESQVVRSQRKKFVRKVNSARTREKPCSSCGSRTQEQAFMSMSSTDKGLLTPDNCAVIFIDHQPQMCFGVAHIGRQGLFNNVLVLAKAAGIFGVPVVLTAVESNEFSGDITPQLLDLFPDQTPIERSSMNAWDDKEFVAAVKKNGRRNFLLAALWSEACLPLHKARTPAQPVLFVRNNGRMDGELNRAAEQHFQLSTEWRNHDDDDDNHRVSERVIGPKKCLTNQILPVADQFLHIGVRVPSAAAMGSAGRRHGGLTNDQLTRQGETTFMFFQSFEGSVRSDLSRRSS